MNSPDAVASASCRAAVPAYKNNTTAKFADSSWKSSAASDGIIARRPRKLKQHILFPNRPIEQPVGDFRHQAAKVGHYFRVEMSCVPL